MSELFVWNQTGGVLRKLLVFFVSIVLLGDLVASAYCEPKIAMISRLFVEMFHARKKDT